MQSITKRLICILPIISLLSSCGFVVRESGFVETDWSKLPDNGTPRALELVAWKEPKVTIGSSCDGTNYTALWGPYFGLPLFIIPNPFWPFTYTYHATHNVRIDVAIASETTSIDWAAISTKLRVNDSWLKPDHVEDASDRSLRRYKYIFDTNMSCGKLENADIEVLLESDPPQANSTTTVRYKYQWRVAFEGM